MSRAKQQTAEHDGCVAIDHDGEALAAYLEQVAARRR